MVQGKPRQELWPFLLGRQAWLPNLAVLWEDWHGALLHQTVMRMSRSRLGSASWKYPRDSAAAEEFHSRSTEKALKFYSLHGTRNRGKVIKKLKKWATGSFLPLHGEVQWNEGVDPLRRRDGHTPQALPRDKAQTQSIVSFDWGYSSTGTNGHTFRPRGPNMNLRFWK